MFVASLTSRWHNGQRQYGCHSSFGVLLPFSSSSCMVLLCLLSLFGRCHFLPLFFLGGAASPSLPFWVVLHFSIYIHMVHT